MSLGIGASGILLQPLHEGDSQNQTRFMVAFYVELTHEVLETDRTRGHGGSKSVEENTENQEEAQGEHPDSMVGVQAAKIVHLVLFFIEVIHI